MLFSHFCLWIDQSSLQLVVDRSEEHTSELQSRRDLVCRLLLEKKNKEPCPSPTPRRLSSRSRSASRFFFFNDTATTEIYTLSLHDALPTCPFSSSWIFHSEARIAAPACSRERPLCTRSRRSCEPTSIRRTVGPPPG